ncbi:MAG: EI24 domain-containing protein [Burkholderiales bacterium]|nr:EI24 domain-containing protein [Burkholderiales bacterium]
MKELLDALWRAIAYCLHPKVIGLSLLPLVIGMVLVGGLGWFYWEAAVAGVRATLEQWAMVDHALRWVEALVGGSFRTVLAPLIVVALALPVVVILSVLLVAVAMTPAMLTLVAERRFPTLERKQGAGLAASVLWSLGCTLLAMLALLISLPLWFIPPLVLLVPPLIWGWLTYRVMSFDVLAAHASAEERRMLMRRHRWQLLAIGIAAGYLGAAPSLLFAVSALTVIAAPLLVGVAIWLYTLVFAFSALWFAHFALAALAALRAEGMPAVVVPPAQTPEPVPNLLPPTP